MSNEQKCARCRISKASHYDSDDVQFGHAFTPTSTPEAEPLAGIESMTLPEVCEWPHCECALPNAGPCKVTGSHSAEGEPPHDGLRDAEDAGLLPAGYCDAAKELADKLGRKVSATEAWEYFKRGSPEGEQEADRLLPGTQRERDGLALYGFLRTSTQPGWSELSHAERERFCRTAESRTPASSVQPIDCPNHRGVEGVTCSNCRSVLVVDPAKVPVGPCAQHPPGVRCMACDYIDGEPNQAFDDGMPPILTNTGKMEMPVKIASSVQGDPARANELRRIELECQFLLVAAAEHGRHTAAKVEQIRRAAAALRQGGPTLEQVEAEIDSLIADADTGDPRRDYDIECQLTDAKARLRKLYESVPKAGEQ